MHLYFAKQDVQAIEQLLQSEHSNTERLHKVLAEDKLYVAELSAKLASMTTLPAT